MRSGVLRLLSKLNGEVSTAFEDLLNNFWGNEDKTYPLWNIVTINLCSAFWHDTG